MKKYFNKVKTVEELRKQYRDENGSTEITQQINQEYDALFAILNRV